jgi:hypothetical protein
VGVVLGRLMLTLLELRVFWMVGLGMLGKTRVFMGLPVAGKRRGGTHRYQEHQSHKFLHGWNVAREPDQG